MAVEGIIDVKSNHSVMETANRLEKILKQKGMTIFNRIPHSVNAAKIGVVIRDTELFIFGNPKVGGPLMKCQQSVAIDLPQKVLIREDETLYFRMRAGSHQNRKSSCKNNKGSNNEIACGLLFGRHTKYWS